MVKCPKCGKSLGLFGIGELWDSQVYHSDWNGQKLHMQYWLQATTEESEAKKKLALCSNCHYYRSESSTEVIDLGLFMPNPKMVTFTSRYCAKFGFELKDGKEAEKCTSYIIKEDSKEKALRGEINPNTDNNFRICPYCQTKFDLNKLSVCPRCGAP